MNIFPIRNLRIKKPTCQRLGEGSNFKFQISNCKGVTLVEFLVVIIIIVILAAIGAVAWQSIEPTLELSATSRELVVDLRYAQQLAIAEQVIYGVRFDFAENKYQIIQYGATEETVKLKLLPQGITLEQINAFNEAKFTPYGSTMESGQVRLVNAQSRAKTIDVRPSGFVKIID